MKYKHFKQALLFKVGSVIDNTGGNTSIEDGKPDTDTAKEHWGSIDSWDSWEYPPKNPSINN